MNKFGQLVVIRNKAQWQQYQAELRASVQKTHTDKSVPVEFPTEPQHYPCLVASLTTFKDVTQIGALSQVDVSCCFVYPKDAARLQAVAGQSSAPRQTAPRQINDMLLDDMDDMDDDDFDDFGPSEIGSLVLALVLELRSLGAIKQDRLITTIGQVREWLEETMHENIEDDDTITILEKLWKAHDAR